jgi:hypothetical protein
VIRNFNVMLSPSSSASSAPKGWPVFLRLYRSGRGDYTKERDKLLNGVTIDDIIEQIRSADHPARPERTG